MSNNFPLQTFDYLITTMPIKKYEFVNNSCRKMWKARKTRLVISLFVLVTTICCSCSGSSTTNSTDRVLCLPHEKNALLNFKHSLAFFNETVSSTWEGVDCCSWSRVTCDNSTAHVLRLYLYGDIYGKLLLELNESSSSLEYLVELKELQYLDLSGNNINSSIPKFIGLMKQLRHLDLSYCSIQGSIPRELGNLSALESLFLSNNNLTGRIPTSIGQLSKLKKLDISDNPMEGAILSETHFANLSSLTKLTIWDTFLTFDLPSNWVPPFQLQLLWADSCKINGKFPRWLQNQTHLTDLYLSDANISGPMPKWLQTSNQIESLDISYNQISGNLVIPTNFTEIIVGNNSLYRSLMPMGKNIVYSNAQIIDFSDNLFSGPLPEDLGHIFPNMIYLDLSGNQFNGKIPKSLCLPNLGALDLQNNRLSGIIPSCWSNFTGFQYLSLSHNKLEGPIPCMKNADTRFSSINLFLGNNLLSGEIPSCLHDTNFEVFDVGDNQLSGVITKWITEKVDHLEILRLRGNKFSGIIPSQICSFSRLRLLDLGHNRFTGSIPHCLSNLTSMFLPQFLKESYIYGHEVDVVFQGTQISYTSTPSLYLFTCIDLSNNNLVGSIPDDITKLSLLINLNLSFNNLSGTIPQSIAGLTSLISLDLSMNRLRGVIPQGMSQLNQLSHLNLSYNNLSGQIPTGTQLETLLDVSIYVGNPYLCGDPLPVKCKSTKDGKHKDAGDLDDDNKEDKLEKLWLYLFVMSGLATGFWGVVGCLVLKQSWRHAVFRCAEDTYDWVYIIITIKIMTKLKK